jgi:hypothetical protein
MKCIKKFLKLSLKHETLLSDKGKVDPVLNKFKHYAMKACGGVDV